MAKRLYDFKILGADGGVAETLRRKCFRAAAPDLAAIVLGDRPDAAAVVAYERKGVTVHAVYRGI